MGRGRGSSIRVARARPRDVGVPRVVAELVEGNDDEGDEDGETDGAEVDVNGVAQGLGGHGWAQEGIATRRADRVSKVLGSVSVE